MNIQQYAFHDVDAFCSPEKQVLMLRNIFDAYDKMKELHETGVELAEITALDVFDDLARMKYSEDIKDLEAIAKKIEKTSADQFNILTV